MNRISMEQAVINYLLQQWIAVVLLSIGGYLLTRYFMWVIDKKDIQNQANLEMFIGLVKSNIEVNSKFGATLEWLHPKLNEMHDDIKRILTK